MSIPDHVEGGQKRGLKNRDPYHHDLYHDHDRDALKDLPVQYGGYVEYNHAPVPRQMPVVKRMI